MKYFRLIKFRKKIFQKKQKSHKTEETKISELVKPEDISPEQRSLIGGRIKSGIKYVYVVILAAFLSVVISPFTELSTLFEDPGASPEFVFAGMLILLLGLSGGILIYKSILHKDFNTKLFLAGIAIIVISAILIFAQVEMGGDLYQQHLGS